MVTNRKEIEKILKDLRRECLVQEAKNKSRENAGAAKHGRSR